MYALCSILGIMVTLFTFEVNISGFLESISLHSQTRGNLSMMVELKVSVLGCFLLMPSNDSSAHAQCLVLLLTAGCPPTQVWKAEADTGLHLMGTRDHCEHKCAVCHCPTVLKDANRWSGTGGSGGDWERYFWIIASEAWGGLTSCDGGGGRAEMTVDNVFSVSDKCSTTKLTIQ